MGYYIYVGVCDRPLSYECNNALCNHICVRNYYISNWVSVQNIWNIDISHGKSCREVSCYIEKAIDQMNNTFEIPEIKYHYIYHLNEIKKILDNYLDHTFLSGRSSGIEDDDSEDNNEGDADEGDENEGDENEGDTDADDYNSENEGDADDNCNCSNDNTDNENEGDSANEGNDTNKILYRAPDETGDTVTYFKHPSGLIKVNNFATALSVFKFMYETDDQRAKAWFNIAYSMQDAP